jgi:hypothetical protein
METGKTERRPRKPRIDAVTTGQRTLFLKALAETFHVGRSAQLAGKSSSRGFYKLRVTDTAFAEQWDEAVKTAIARIEAGLMARAIATFEAQAAAEAAGETGVLPPLGFDQLMQLLKYYRTPPADRPPAGRKRRYATPEETDAALMQKLDRLEARVRARLVRERAERREARAAKAAAKAAADAAEGAGEE